MKNSIILNEKEFFFYKNRNTQTNLEAFPRIHSPSSSGLVTLKTSLQSLGNLLHTSSSKKSYKRNFIEIRFRGTLKNSNLPPTALTKFRSSSIVRAGLPVSPQLPLPSNT